ncbi:MAG: Ig-like domain-containing protein [Clostridiales bacterium]|nr:Ig-like domain-containing protein [Clostridiales bacterium]
MDTELELKGSAAEEYQELLEAGGNLYEIEPVIDNTDSDRDKVLNLRAFVRLENDIELDSAYVMDGAEEVTFLLVNSSDVYQQATISVDGRESETITVLPASAVAVDEEEAGPGVTGTGTNFYTNVTGSISKSSGGSGGGGSNDISTDVEDNTQTDGTETIDTNTDDAENVDIVIKNNNINDSDDGTDSIVEVQIEANTDNNAQDPEESEGSTEGQQGITDIYGADDDTTGTQKEMGDTQGKNEEVSNLETDSDPIDDNTTSSGEVADGDITNGESEDGADQTSEPENSDVTDDSGPEAADDDVESGTDESGNHDTTDEQDSDPGDETDDENEEVGNDETYASAISVHMTYLLAATATSSDAEEATPSDAYGLNGQTYETVLVGGEAAVAYVTEASELGLDQIESITYSAETDDIEVSVEAPVGAFAAGVTMEVTEADSENFAEAVQNDLDENYPGTTYTIIDSQAITISFYDQDGNEVEPSEDVEVTISNLSLSTENEDGVEAEYALIYHMMDDGSVEWIEDQTPGQESYTFTASSFSSYGVAAVSADDEISVASISGDTTVAVGSTITLTSNEGGNMNPDHEWSSDDTNIATVSSNGKSATVKGVSEGTVTITHKYKDGKDGSWTTEEYTVTVTASGSSSGTTYYHIDIRLGGNFTATVTNTTEDKVDVTVTKVWDVEEGTTLPDSITVYLENSSGERVKEQILTSSNADESGNWIYTWEDLELNAGTYTVKEEIPDGYTAAYIDQTFTITDSDNTSDTATYTGTVTITSLSSVTIHYSNGDTEDVSVTAGGTDTTSKASEYQSDHFNFEVTLSDDDYIELVASYTYVYYDTEGNEIDSGNVENDSIIVYTTYANNVCGSKDATGDMRGYDLEISGAKLLENANIITTNEECTITNTLSTTDITVKKLVTGKMGDTTKKFTITVNDMNYELADGEYTEISGLTVGSTITLMESGNEGYDTPKVEYNGKEVTANDDGSYSITLVSGATEITVTNNKDGNADTGINLESIPYMLLLAVAVIPGAFLLFRRRSQWF